MGRNSPQIPGIEDSGAERRATAKSLRHLPGLDSVRFLAAAVVVVSHYGLTPYNASLLPTTTERGHAAAMVLACMISGPAAVIVFFVISGLCIHLRYAHGEELSLPNFYARRLLRIVPPMIVFYLLLYRFALHSWRSPNNTVLWSVLCELVYYALYPALLGLRRRRGWTPVFVLAIAGAADALILKLWRAPVGPHSYVDLGWATWMIGLPCWLVGCVLAEQYQRLPALSTVGIWVVRVAILGWSSAVEYMHAASFSPWAHAAILLDLFSVGAAFWLGLEVARFRERSPSQLLEWAGRWSYSLYLVHSLIPHWGVLPHWLPFVWAVVASYVFYLLVERPSHRLAIRVGRTLVPHSVQVLA